MVVVGPEYFTPNDPEINWNTLVVPINELTKLSWESSVRLISPPDPEIRKFKDPGNRDSLYLARSIESTQKFDPVTTFVPFPKTKLAFSSYKIKARYWPNMVFVGEFPGTILLNQSLPLPKASAYTMSNCVSNSEAEE